MCILHAHVEKEDLFDVLWKYVNENSKLTLLYFKKELFKKEFGPFPQKRNYS